MSHSSSQRLLLFQESFCLGMNLWMLQGWVDAEEAEVPSYEDIVGAHDDEDEAYDNQADQFEAAYNFRFEVSSAVWLCLFCCLTLTTSEIGCQHPGKTLHLTHACLHDIYGIV